MMGLYLISAFAVLLSGCISFVSADSAKSWDSDQHYAQITPVDPYSPDVRRALMYAVRYIHTNEAVGNYYGPFDRTFTHPFNVQASAQNVGGMIYRFTFEVMSRPKCMGKEEKEDCRNYRQYHTSNFGTLLTVPRLFVCSSSVWDRPWMASDRYVFMRRPSCVQLVS